jgi:CHAT domain-containing protein
MRAYARTLLAGGRREEALRLYLGAAEILKKAGKPRALLVASTDIATILHASGLLEQALPHYRNAIDALDYLFAQTRGLDEQSRYSFLGQYAQVYRNMLELLLELNRRQPGGNHAREALAVASRNQSRIFSELLRAADVARIAKNVGFAALKKERDGTADELAALRGSAATLPPTEFNVALKKRNLENRIAEMERQLAGLDARLWKEYPRYMELARPRAVTVEEIQKRLLKPGDALLSYVLLPGETAIFAVTRERFALIARPLPRDEAARLVSAVRTPAEDLAISGNLKALTNLDPADLHALYRELIQPAEPTLKGANKVLVVGDGPINTLPFEMLVTRYDEGAKRAFAAARGEHTGSRGKPLLGEYAGLAYLGSQYRFAYLPSLAALASQRLHAKPPVKYDRELVSFADPIFEQEGGQTYNEATRSALNRLAASRSLRSGGASVGLSRLQETADEAREIARTLGGRHDIYLREQAQEATVKSIDLKTTRYLHFATHGLLGGEFLQVQQALPAPSPDKGPRTSLRNLAVAEKPAQASFPPTRPGTAAAMGQPALALTLVGTAGGEDGLLTMGEVLESLDLNAQVVVLSASPG